MGDSWFNAIQTPTIFLPFFIACSCGKIKAMFILVTQENSQLSISAALSINQETPYICHINYLKKKSTT